jgi:hypothetical protein
MDIGAVGNQAKNESGSANTAAITRAKTPPEINTAWMARR